MVCQIPLLSQWELWVGSLEGGFPRHFRDLMIRLFKFFNRKLVVWMKKRVWKNKVSKFFEFKAVWLAVSSYWVYRSVLKHGLRRFFESIFLVLRWCSADSKSCTALWFSFNTRILFELWLYKMMTMEILFEGYLLIRVQIVF